MASPAPFTPRVTLDTVTGDAYIYLARDRNAILHPSPVKANRCAPKAMGSLMLDFDEQDRLCGIEVCGDAQSTLHPDLLMIAECDEHVEDEE